MLANISMSVQIDLNVENGKRSTRQRVDIGLTEEVTARKRKGA